MTQRPLLPLLLLALFFALPGGVWAGGGTRYFKGETALSGLPALVEAKPLNGSAVDYSLNLLANKTPYAAKSTLGFQGKLFDPVAGAYYNHARFYHNGLGRFLTPDPTGPWGDPASLGNPYT